MGKFKIKKLNNQGSTFVLSLLVIMLLTTLAFALASASLTNMMMKSVDRGSKKTFYTSETLVDEIRAGIGHDSVSNLAKAYETVLTNIVQLNTSGFGAVMDNDKANDEFKRTYIDNVLYAIAGNTMRFSGDKEFLNSSVDATDESALKANVINYISGYIQGKQYDIDIAKITSVGDVKAYKNPKDLGYKWIVIIEDVAVTYKEKKAGEIYFSNITVDLEIGYPNMKVDFTISNRINDFTEYSMIADHSIVVDGRDVNVNSSVYAGHVIDIAPSTNGNKGSNVKFESLSNENINVVCGGDNSNSGIVSGTIRVGGSTSVTSEAHFKGVNIWCTNIATRRTTDHKGAKITIDNKSNAFVKDDLSVDADRSDITVAGNYYGYMYEGPHTAATHGSSSAMVVNGKYSKVSIGAKYLFLAGRSYVDFTSVSSSVTEGYMTGEALSLKGSQEVYLIPAAYLGKDLPEGTTLNITNPMSAAVWGQLETLSRNNASVKICELPEGYFAKDLVNPTYPYEIRQIGQIVYVYWNFKDNASAAAYIKAVASGADADLKAKLDKYNKSILGDAGTSVVVGTESSKIYSTGVLMEVENGSTSSTPNSSTMGEDMVVRTSTSLQNRYDVITHLLVSLPWKKDGMNYYAMDVEDALKDLRGIQVNDELNKTKIITNIVSMLNDSGQLIAEYNSAGKEVEYGTTDTHYIKIAKNGHYTIPARIQGGIVIATGTVTVDHDFNGLIIAGEDIKIVGNATIKTNSNMVEEFIIGKEQFRADGDYSPGQYLFKEYFYAYKSSGVDEDSSEEIKIENVDYKDLVNFSNWRKYEDK